MSRVEDQLSSSVDFISQLPPEVVLYVIHHLNVDEAIHCLRVSRSWFYIVSGLEPFWRQACHNYGLPEKLVDERLPTYKSAKELLMAAKRHRSLLYATPPQLKVVTSGFPYDVHCVCQYARGEDMVSVLYRDFRPCEILVEKLLHDSVQLQRRIKLGTYRTAENRVVWSHLFGDFLYCATASGVWSVYFLSLSSLPLLEWKSEPLYDPDQRIGCCPDCHMVCTCKLVCTHSTEPHYWEVRLISVNETAALQCVDLKRDVRYQKTDLQVIMKFRLKAANMEISARQSTSAMKKATLLSCTAERDSKGRCLSHKLLLQWANVISSHHVAVKGSQIFVSSSPECEYTIPCDHKHLEVAIVRNHGLNSEFELSNDHKLIGTIFQSHLIVWDVDTTNELSIAKIVLDKYSYEQMKLIALGHIYSVVGLEFSNVVLVVVNSTGAIVLKCVNFARKHCTMLPPYIDFLTVVRSDWLSDITCPCSRDRPAVTFWNKTNRSVEGLYFGKAHDPGTVEGPPSTKRKRHWWQLK